MKYNMSQLIRSNEITVVETGKENNIEWVSFTWNGGFYKWIVKYKVNRFIKKFKTLDELLSGEEFGSKLIYGTTAQKQQKEEGRYIYSSLNNIGIENLKIKKNRKQFV